MGVNILNKLLVIVIVLILIIIAALFVIGEPEKKGFVHYNSVTGIAKSYEVSHGAQCMQYKHVKTSERYDDKYFEYLEHIQDRRAKSFNRGVVYFSKEE